jgi:ABC-type transporter MlaC component
MFIRFVFVIFSMLLLSTPEAYCCEKNTQIAVEKNADQRTKSKELTEELGNKALAVINRQGVTAEQVSIEFRKLLNEYFALEEMGESALGKYLKDFARDDVSFLKSPTSAFRKSFVNMLVKVYTSRFSEFRGAKFLVNQVRKKSANQCWVYSEIIIPGKKNIAVVWIISLLGDAPKILDAEINGIRVGRLQQADIMGRIGQVGPSNFLKEFTEKY